MGGSPVDCEDNIMIDHLFRKRPTKRLVMSLSNVAVDLFGPGSNEASLSVPITSINSQTFACCVTYAVNIDNQIEFFYTFQCRSRNEVQDISHNDIIDNTDAAQKIPQKYADLWQ